MGKLPYEISLFKQCPSNILLNYKGTMVKILTIYVYYLNSELQSLSQPRAFLHLLLYN